MKTTGLRWFRRPGDSDISLVRFAAWSGRTMRVCVTFLNPLGCEFKVRVLCVLKTQQGMCVACNLYWLNEQIQNRTASFGWIHLKMRWAETTITRHLTDMIFTLYLSRNWKGDVRLECTTKPYKKENKYRDVACELEHKRPRRSPERA